jgi:hypothetical protein
VAHKETVLVKRRMASDGKYAKVAPEQMALAEKRWMALGPGCGRVVREKVVPLRKNQMVLDVRYGRAAHGQRALVGELPNLLASRYEKERWCLQCGR